MFRGLGFLMRFIAGFLFFLLIGSCGAYAERRVALVMGADGYETIRPLDNAVADAIAMKDALETLGFEVFLETDRDLRRMRRALEDFVYDAEKADVALVFFAGHGVEIDGRNRLLPVDADASSLEALEKSTLALEEVRDTVAEIAPIGLIVLDACRDDPFGAPGDTAGRGATALSAPELPASVKPGLGRMGRSENVLFAFAAAPGETAADGTGDNSPFTTALTKYLATDGLEIRSVLTLVQQEVYDRTRGRQLPYVESGLPKTFFASTSRDELPERERLLLAMADVTPQLRDEVERIAAENEMPLAPLYGALVGSDLARLSIDDRRAKLTEAAVAFGETRKKLRLLSSSDPQVTQLRIQAEDSLSLGALAEAGDLLERAIAIDDESRRTVGNAFLERTLSQAASLQARAGVARTALEHSAAIAALEDAAELHRQIAALDVADGARGDRNLLLMDLGNLYRLVGDTTKALDAFQRMRDAAIRRAEASPDNPAARLDLSTSHNGIGSLLLARGDLDGALTAYREATTIRERLAAAYPDNHSLQGDLSENLSRMARVLAERGNRTEALDSYEASIAIRQRLAETDPGNTDWQRALSITHSRIGDLHTTFGDLRRATADYEASLAISRHLVQQNPGNPSWQHGLALGHAKMGDVLARQGYLTRALGAYRASLDTQSRLVASDPANTTWLRDLSVIQNQTGEVFAKMANYAEALAAHRDSLATQARLVAIDPANTTWKRDYALGQVSYGDLLSATGDLDGALAAFRAGQALLQQLAVVDPGNMFWQWDIASSHDRIGDALLARRDPEGAMTAYRAGLEIAERLVAADPGNMELQFSLSSIHISIGDVLSQEGNHVEALKIYEAALAVRQRVIASSPANSGWQHSLSIAFERVGDARRRSGDAAGALDAYRSDLAIIEGLASAEPANAAWQNSLSLVQVRIGDALRARGDREGALAAYQEALAIRERLAAANPGQAVLQHRLSVRQVIVGDMLRELGKPDAALEYYQASLAIHKMLLAANPDNAARQRDLLISHYKIAKAGGEPHKHFRAALDIAERMEKAGRLAPADRSMPDILRTELDALGTTAD